MLLIFVWVGAVSLGVEIGYGDIELTPVQLKYFPYVYNGSVIAFTTAAYITILAMVKLSGRKANRSDSMKPKTYLLPLFIVISFFMFNFLPIIIIHNIPVTQKALHCIVMVVEMVSLTNFLVDPIIYIFFQPKVKREVRLVTVKLSKRLLAKDSDERAPLIRYSNDQ